MCRSRSQLECVEVVAAEGTVIGAVVALAVGTSMETGKGRGLKLNWILEQEFVLFVCVYVFVGAFVK